MDPETTPPSMSLMKLCYCWSSGVNTVCGSLCPLPIRKLSIWNCQLVPGYLSSTHLLWGPGGGGGARGWGGVPIAIQTETSAFTKAACPSPGGLPTWLPLGMWGFLEFSFSSYLPFKTFISAIVIVPFFEKLVVFIRYESSVEAL